ncbi:hypothetical protein N9J26_01510 [bacterium]|nr:hypothetical protein [bacterium]
MPRSNNQLSSTTLVPAENNLPDAEPSANSRPAKPLSEPLSEPLDEQTALEQLMEQTIRQDDLPILPNIYNGAFTEADSGLRSATNGHYLVPSSRHYQHCFSKLTQLMDSIDQQLLTISDNEIDNFFQKNQHTLTFNGGQGARFSVHLQKTSAQLWHLSINNIDLSDTDLMQLTNDLRRYGPNDLEEPNDEHSTITPSR